MLHNLALRETAQYALGRLEAEESLGPLPRSIEENWGAVAARRLQQIVGDPRLLAERGFLYIIPTEVSGVWKIGKTDNLKRRLGGYQTGRATAVQFVHTRPTLEQHVAEKLLKELLKTRAFTVGSPDESKTQRLRELFQVDLEAVKQLLNECCLTASTMLMHRMALLAPPGGGGSPLVSSEKLTELMQSVDRFVGAVIHSANLPGKNMVWYKPGEIVDPNVPLVDLLQRMEYRAEDLPVIQALLFDRLVASRTTCVLGTTGEGDQQQVRAKLRTPEDVRARMGQVVYDFEVVVEPAPAPPAAAAAAGSTPAEERRPRSTSLDQAREVQKFVDWIGRTKPEWAASGKTVTMRELHGYYKALPDVEALGERIVFGKVRELMKCEKIKVTRGEQTLTALKFP